MDSILESLSSIYGGDFFPIIAADEKVLFATTLTLWLGEKYGIKTTCSFKNVRRSIHRKKDYGSHITYSYSSLKKYYIHGWDDYYTVNAMWYQVFSKGMNSQERFIDSGQMVGVACLVLHEFAHALQRQNGTDYKNGKRDVHGLTFLIELQRLINEVSIDEIVNEITNHKLFKTYLEVSRIIGE